MSLLPGVSVTESVRLADQIRRAFEGNAWHGDSILELLADVNAKTAAARPIAKAHSIWEILLHIAAWDDAVRRRIRGTAVTLNDEQNFPPVKDTSDAAWRQGGGRVPRRAPARAGPGQDREVLQLLLHVQRHRPARALSCRADLLVEEISMITLVMKSAAIENREPKSDN
jgi:hypothetical protein